MNSPSLPAFPSAYPPPAPAPSGPTLLDYIGKHRLLKAKIDEIKERHAAELEPFNRAKTALDNYLMEQVISSGAKSIRTAAGTVGTTTTISYSVEDPVVFREWVEANKRPDLYENRPSKSALDHLMEQGGELPPGLKVSSFTRISVRAPTK